MTKTLKEHLTRAAGRRKKTGEILGLVFGAWGEGSLEVHSLVETLAQCRLRFQKQQEGRPDQGSDNKWCRLNKRR